MPAWAHQPLACAAQMPANSTFLIQFRENETLVLGAAWVMDARGSGMSNVEPRRTADNTKRRNTGVAPCTALWTCSRTTRSNTSWSWRRGLRGGSGQERHRVGVASHQG